MAPVISRRLARLRPSLALRCAAAAGISPSLDLRQAELGELVGDHDVAAQHQLHAAAEREAVDRAMIGLVVVLDGRIHVRSPRLEGIELQAGLGRIP